MSLFIVLIGFFGITFFFSDFAPGETIVSRGVIVAVYYFTAAFFLTIFSGIRWWTAGFVAWGAIILGVTAALNNFMHDQNQILTNLGISCGPFLISILGGLLGTVTRTRFALFLQRRITA